VASAAERKAAERARKDAQRLTKLELWLPKPTIGQPMSESHKELYGWWGKYIKGGKAIKWIGPMSEKRMKEKHDSYRHMFRDKAPDQLSDNQTKEISE
jgi:hypothetical protein